MLDEIWTLPDRLPLFGRVLGDFVSQLWAFHDWGGLWIAALAGALWLGMKGRRRPLLLAGGVVVPMVVLYAAVIAVADWDLRAMIGSVAPRAHDASRRSGSGASRARTRHGAG